MAVDGVRLTKQVMQVDILLCDARLHLATRLTLDKPMLPAIKAARELLNAAADKLLDLEVELED